MNTYSDTDDEGEENPEKDFRKRFTRTEKGEELGLEEEGEDADEEQTLSTRESNPDMNEKDDDEVFADDDREKEST